MVRAGLREEENREVYAVEVRLGVWVEQEDRPVLAERETGSEFNRVRLTGEHSYALNGEMLKDEMME